MKLKNIDVTLRDGGYRNSFNFTEEYIKTHVQNIGLSNMDWIEIGYRNGSFRPIPGIGLTGLCETRFVESLREKVERSCLAVMLHPKNIKEQDLVDLAPYVGMIRICVDIKDINSTIKYCDLAKSLGYVVSVNFTRITEIPIRQIIKYAKSVDQSNPDVIYFADSNGNMTPHIVEELISTSKEVLSSEIGFHAHDNVGLAISNSTVALQSGASYIDSSLRGMGKGAGNLKTETWLAYLYNELYDENYDNGLILTQAKILEECCSESTVIQPLGDLISGMFNLNVEKKEKLVFAEPKDYQKRYYEIVYGNE